MKLGKFKKNLLIAFTFGATLGGVLVSQADDAAATIRYYLGTVGRVCQAE
ncbi:hypothetical protein [Liquorilactobacillus sucicola]|nr:hypothetical protein [Liquorilactobacillus sucicola]